MPYYECIEHLLEESSCNDCHLLCEGGKKREVFRYSYKTNKEKFTKIFRLRMGITEDISIEDGDK